MASISGQEVLLARTKSVACTSATSQICHSVTLPPLRSSFLPNGIANASVLQRFVASSKCSGRRKRLVHLNVAVAGSLRKFDSNDFEVLRLLSTFGYLNISSYVPPQSSSSLGGNDNLAAGYNQRDLMQMSGPDMGEGGVHTRFYAGRIARGEEMGTRVLLKAYPGVAKRGTEVDTMAANELISHSCLQGASPGGTPRHIAQCFGGFSTRTREQWLVFQDWGQFTAADYAKEASQATVEKRAVGQWDFWDRFDQERPIRRRRVFIIKLLRGAFSGLAFMHANDRLHQSLGPASIILNTLEERDVQYLVPQLRDLAFAVDVSDQAMQGSPTSSEAWERVNTVSDLQDLRTEPEMSALSAGLWRRAGLAGANTMLEKRSFGIADDIYAGGLLFAYVIFVSLSEPGSTDGPSLQRLFESTFRLDISTAREFLKADDRWGEAVRFLDLDDGAGWQLLQALLNPNYRMRPTAEAVLNHRFMTGDVLYEEKF